LYVCKRYVALENLLQETNSAATCHEVLAGYEDIDPDRLTVQLAMARQQQWDMSSVSVVSDKLRSDSGSG